MHLLLAQAFPDIVLVGGLREKVAPGEPRATEGIHCKVTS